MEEKRQEKESTKGGANWKEVVIGGVSGIAFGSGATLLMGSTTNQEGESIFEEEAENPAESETPAQEPVIYGHAPMATHVNDSMSFGEAFGSARAEVGPGGVFEWHGHLYGTYYATEWDAMDSDARDEYASSVQWHSSSHSNAANPIAPNSATASATHDNVSTHVEEHQSEEEPEETASVNDGNENENEEADFEIIGVEHANIDGEHDSIIGAASVEGQAVYFVDIDGTDDQFDVMISDLNNNNDIEENEVFDISDQHISVSQFEQMAQTSNDTPDDNLDEMYANNDNLPDYVNDVDPGNLD